MVSVCRDVPEKRMSKKNCWPSFSAAGLWKYLFERSTGGLSGSPASEVIMSHSSAEYSQLAVPQKNLSAWLPQPTPARALASRRGGVRRRIMGNPRLVVSITVYKNKNTPPRYPWGSFCHRRGGGIL